MDILTKHERSRRMSGVRSKRNRSTEWKVRSALMREGVRGWKMNVRSLPGAPDFVFPDLNVVIFIDGCFWHGCQKCARPLPKSHRAYWIPKLRTNIARRRRVSRQLRHSGFRIIRVWEHEVSSQQTLSKLLAGFHA